MNKENYNGSFEVETNDNQNLTVLHPTLKPLYSPSALYKAACIDFLIEKYKCQIIASEFRYGTSQQITDIVAVTRRNTISIEIKTEQDDLRRLKSQISEARKNFNLTIVFASARHKDELLGVLPPDVGIVIFDNRYCDINRAPKRNIPLNLEIAASIPAAFLRSFFKIPNILNSDKTRLFVIGKFANSIQECFRAFLRYKFHNNYEQFLSDRGEKTHIDDIPTLTMKSIIEIK